MPIQTAEALTDLLDRLRARIEELEARNAELTKALAYREGGDPLRLPPIQRTIYEVLMTRVTAQYDLLFTAIENRNGRIVTGETLKVHVSYLRRRLEPFGVKIHNASGEGYYITGDDKRRLDNV